MIRLAEDGTTGWKAEVHSTADRGTNIVIWRCEGSGWHFMAELRIPDSGIDHDQLIEVTLDNLESKNRNGQDEDVSGEKAAAG